MMKQTTPYQSSVAATVSPPTITLPATTTTTTKNRCACCAKKLTLTDFACGKCQIRHCAAHRLPETHTCNHDFKTAGREQLTQQLIRVVGDKIEHI